MSDKFELTTEGYLQAVEYLKSIGMYERYANSSQNDGYSITNAANCIYEKSLGEGIVEVEVNG